MLETTLIVTLIGLSLGSFVNVCAYRVPRQMSLVGTSFCPSCKRPLQWYQLIPLVGFFISRMRCASCGGRISLHYPILEAAMGMIGVGLFVKYGPTWDFLAAGTFITIMLLVAVIDWRHLVIPNDVVVTGLICGISLILFSETQGLLESIIASLLAIEVLLSVLLIGNLVLRKECMGMGDVKLAGVIGLFVGFQGFLVSLWLAAIVALLYASIRSSKNRTSRSHFSLSSEPLPFGSFLALVSSGVLVWRSEIEALITGWLL